MFDYFRGWKRKVGLVTLAVAIVSAVAWARSIPLAESFMIAGCGRQLIVVSACQRLLIRVVGDQYIGIECDVDVGSSEYHPHNLLSPSGTPAHFIATSVHATWAKTQFSREDGSISPPLPMTPYSSIVIPLTLMSAWLLLSKRRQPTNPDPSPEPAA